MKAYLIRHGEAADDVVDQERPLTETGIKETEVSALLLESLGNVKPTVIYYSGLLRSCQTAEIFAKHLSPVNGTQFLDNLKPFDDPQPLVDIFNIIDSDIMVVGHMPHISLVAAFLLTDNFNGIYIPFIKSKGICLEKTANKKWRMVPTPGF
jgi:phosphohistidine phosphatase